jgi:hypothetical protein
MRSGRFFDAQVAEHVDDSREACSGRVGRRAPERQRGVGLVAEPRSESLLQLYWGHVSTQTLVRWIRHNGEKQG